MTTPLSEITDTDDKPDENSLDTKGNQANLFSLFQVGNEFPAHANLVRNVLNIFKSHPLTNILQHLEVYQITLQTFKSFDVNKLPTELSDYGNRDTPIPSFENYPIAAVFLSELPKKRLAKNSVYIFQLLLILAIMSKQYDESIIVKAANSLRLASNNADSEKIFEEFHSIFDDMHDTRQLFNTISTNSKIRENGRAKSLFNSFKRLLKYIPLSASKICDIQQSIPFIDAEDVSTLSSSIPITFQATSDVIKTEPNDQCIVYTDDNMDVLTDIADEEITKAVKDIVSNEDIAETKKIAKEASRDIGAITSGFHSLYYPDNDYNKYATNLFNEIERNWLATELKKEATTSSQNVTSLVISLSICLSINYSEVLEMVIGDEEKITPDGYYRKVVPDAEKAIKPSNTDNQYIQHINDSSTPYIYLPLPGFITKKIEKITKEKLIKKPKVYELFKEKDDPSQLIKYFIANLNKTYSQRFITNRLSCQLRQYTKSIYNDPSLTYALFGNKNQRAPAAFYYRAITIGQLVKTYEKLVNDYFK